MPELNQCPEMGLVICILHAFQVTLLMGYGWKPTDYTIQSLLST